VRASADTTASRVGDRIEVTIEVEPSPGWRVDPPEKTLDLGTFRLRGSVERLPRAAGEAFRLVVIPLEPGDLEIPAIQLTARGPEGAVAEIRTAPIALRVESNLPAPEEGKENEEPPLAAMKPPLAAERDWGPLVIALVLLALAAAFGAWLLRKLRRAKRPATKHADVIGERGLHRPAWEIALEELDRIARANYVGRGELSKQYVEVTEALRRYLENRYGVPALESTTSELHELLRTTTLSGELSARILSLLREADFVKFAKASPQPSEARTAETRARALIVETIPAKLESSEGVGSLLASGSAR
jgi:hypothetical protein